jgi:hypothetical protein
MSSGRFLGLAPCATAGIGFLTLAVIGIPAFPANKTLFPFHFGEERKTLLFRRIILRKMNMVNMFENVFHDKTALLNLWNSF